MQFQNVATSKRGILMILADAITNVRSGWELLRSALLTKGIRG